MLVSPSAWELKILVWKRRHFELKPLAPVYPYISIWIIKVLSLLDFVNWRRIIYFRLNRLWSTSPQSETSKWRWLFAEISHPTKKIRKEFRRLKILNFRDLNPRDFTKNGVVAQERHTEPRVTMERLLAKPRSSQISLLFQILMVAKYHARTRNRTHKPIQNFEEK